MNQMHNNPNLIRELHALNIALAQAQMTYGQLRAKLAQAKFELENAQMQMDKFVKQNKIMVNERIKN